MAFFNFHYLRAASVSISTALKKKVFKNPIGFTTFSVKRKNVACSDLSELAMVFHEKGFIFVIGNEGKCFDRENCLNLT